MAKRFTMHNYIVLAKECGYRGLPFIMQFVLEDLLEHFPRNKDPQGFLRAAVAIFEQSTKTRMLRACQVLALYDAMIAVDANLPLLSEAVWLVIVDAAIKEPEACEATLESIGTAILSQREQLRKPSISLTHAVGHIVLELLLQGQAMFPQVLTVFQTLVQHNLISGVDDRTYNEGSFKIIIARTLIIGYSQADAHVQAIDAITTLLKDARWAQGEGTTCEDRYLTGIIALDVLHLALHNPNADVLASCSQLIQLLLPKTPPVPPSCLPIDIPERVIFTFYERCHIENCLREAAAVYVHLQSPTIRNSHHYLPPQDTDLFWLFAYFADPGLTTGDQNKPSPFKGYTYMAKEILRDIIVRQIPIPVNDRRKFVGTCAARGFAFYARHLYELWSDDKDLDHRAVRGSGHMLVPVVKLFRKLHLVWNKSQQHTVKKKEHEYQKRSMLPDALQFANHVVDQFALTKQPLMKASQQDLNALARAYLLLDRMTEGTQTLYYILERGGIPDSKDVNVALTAISKYSPQKAVEMLEYAISMGLTPTASSFSALIHAAYVKNMPSLATQLALRARELGHGELTPKALVTITQQKLNGVTAADVQTQTQKIEDVMEMVQTVVNSDSRFRQHRDHGKNHVLSAKMGNRYIFGALSARNVPLAMKFWRLLVKKRVAWDDRESEKVRLVIGSQINFEVSEGQMHIETANALLDELGLSHMKDNTAKYS
ncbi:hypothetical protein BU17DRAFT_61644 [Hysterangium stoloniferum]|nr:hypothetical protein BU17DRAFT_61644 [Hysterangium stoloniferum]